METHPQQYERLLSAIDNFTPIQRSKLLKFFTNFNHIAHDIEPYIVTFESRPIGEHFLPKGYPANHQLVLSPVENYEQMFNELAEAIERVIL